MLGCNQWGSGEKHSSLQGRPPVAQPAEGREKLVCGGRSASSLDPGGDPQGCVPQGCGQRLP